MNFALQSQTIPVRETIRLAALDSYGVLDTPPERQFNHFVEVAAREFGTPISLISLVDRNRQWFKARIGLPARETGREHAFCAHVIDTRTSLVVRDATLDARFSANPLVTGRPRICFYAGAPLVTPLNQCLGTLNVIDTVARAAWNEHDTLALEAMAAEVMAALETRRADLVIRRALSERPN